MVVLAELGQLGGKQRTVVTGQQQKVLRFALHCRAQSGRIKFGLVRLGLTSWLFFLSLRCR